MQHFSFRNNVFGMTVCIVKLYMILILFIMALGIWGVSQEGVDGAILKIQLILNTIYFIDII